MEKDKIFSDSRLEDFRLLSKLGEGTFSVVLKVKNKKSNEVFAMKRFRKTFQSVDEVEGLREIQALRRLNPHPHIIDLQDVIFEPKHGILSLNFELMDCNLYEMISKRAPKVTDEKAKMYMLHICRGLEYIHSKGIFHRDIKPENILVREGHIKIADFGSCRGIHSKQPFTEYIATRWYRSPECLLCDGMYNYKMDMWGAGCVLFEIVARAPLFPGADELDQLHKIHNVVGTPSQKVLRHMLGFSTLKYNFPPRDGTGVKALIPHVSADCIDLINCLLAYDPDDRYSSKDSLKHSYFLSALTSENSKTEESDSKRSARKKPTLPQPELTKTTDPQPQPISNTYIKTKPDLPDTTEDQIPDQQVTTKKPTSAPSAPIDDRQHPEPRPNHESKPVNEMIPIHEPSIANDTISEDKYTLLVVAPTQVNEKIASVGVDKHRHYQKEQKLKIDYEVDELKQALPVIHKRHSTPVGQKHQFSNNNNNNIQENSIKLPTLGRTTDNIITNKAKIEEKKNLAATVVSVVSANHDQNLVKLPQLGRVIEGNHKAKNVVGEEKKSYQQDAGSVALPLIQRRMRKIHESSEKMRIMKDDEFKTTQKTKKEEVGSWNVGFGVVGKQAGVNGPKFPSLVQGQQQQQVGQQNQQQIGGAHLPSLNVRSSFDKNVKLNHQRKESLKFPTLPEKIKSSFGNATQQELLTKQQVKNSNPTILQAITKPAKR